MCEEAQGNKVGGPVHMLGGQEHVGQQQVKMINFQFIVELSVTSDYVKK